MPIPSTASFSVSRSEKQNEDAFLDLARADGVQFIAIADGVGGSSSGAVSSKIAVETLEQWIEQGGNNITDPFYRTDEKLKRLTHENPEAYSSLATTLTVATIENHRISFAHVGDCRLYLLRGNGLQTFTKDQTEAQQLFELGVLSKRRMKGYTRANVLLSALGSNRPFELQTGDFTAQPGDRIMLCSDGLYKTVAKRQIAELSSQHVTVQDFMSALKDLTIAASPSDDATAIAIEL